MNHSKNSVLRIFFAFLKEYFFPLNESQNFSSRVKIFQSFVQFLQNWSSPRKNLGLLQDFFVAIVQNRFFSFKIICWAKKWVCLEWNDHRRRRRQQRHDDVDDNVTDGVDDDIGKKTFLVEETAIARRSSFVWLNVHQLEWLFGSHAAALLWSPVRASGVRGVAGSGWGRFENNLIKNDLLTYKARRIQVSQVAGDFLPPSLTLTTGLCFRDLNLASNLKSCFLVG